MKEIRITPGIQLLSFAAILALIAALIAVQLPELKRYMKIRSM